MATTYEDSAPPGLLPLPAGTRALASPRRRHWSNQTWSIAIVQSGDAIVWPPVQYRNLMRHWPLILHWLSEHAQSAGSDVHTNRACHIQSPTRRSARGKVSKRSRGRCVTASRSGARARPRMYECGTVQTAYLTVWASLGASVNYGRLGRHEDGAAPRPLYHLVDRTSALNPTLQHYVVERSSSARSPDSEQAVLDEDVIDNACVGGEAAIDDLA
ncbi:hypothetical protein HD554DRAFT_2241040 [Boletus coccyginus]|nr:hypothetical protein HD554DRAFT_2241040 [Boletus coccyginus]